MNEVLLVKELCAHIGNFQLKNINLDVKNSEIVAMLGENGSGKTTLLNAIAGLIKIDKGKIILNGVDVTKKDPEERNIGYIFQNLALFPHLTVEKNIKFGLRFRHLPNSEKRFSELVNFFKLENLLKKYPRELSGGEKQKVAIARSLVLDPALILFDEPTSQLSPQERERVSLEIKEIIKGFGKSAIFVTHNLDEASIISDRIAVIDKGEILQIGEPWEIFYSPQHEEVARISGVNTLKGHVINNEEEIVKVEVNGDYVYVLGKYNPGDKILIFIHPEEITLSKTASKTSARNQFEGKVERIITKNGLSTISVRISENLILNAVITRKSLEELNLKIGENVYLSFKITAIHSVKVS